MQGGDRRMTEADARSAPRDSLFMLADLRVEQSAEARRVRVRNLSDAGMMGEGQIRIQRGNRVAVELRSVGTVYGTVAWVQDDRFGVAFDHDIDSQKARRPLQVPDDPVAAIVGRSWLHRASMEPPPPEGPVRKI
jgi:hypothetical protein